MPTSTAQQSNAASSEDSEDLVYAYKSSLMTAPFEFRLGPDALHWQKGRFTGQTPYDRIHRIRLSFRPVSMQTHRFMAEIWPVDGPKLPIASTSVRGIVEQDRFDAQFRAFITELHRRIAAAGGTPLLQTGSPTLLYWPGVLVFAGASLALAALTVRALQVDSWSAAAFIAGFLALFLWQAGWFFRLNMPGSYRLDALPAQLLPKG